MPNLNKVFLMGNLTRDPELRYTPSGQSVATLRLAVNRRFTTRQGENRDETLFIDVTVWGKQAEICSQYMSKGRPIMIEGRLKQDTWKTPDGQSRSKIGVVAENFQFLGGGGGGRQGGGPGGSGDDYPGQPDTEEDEIAF
jgi:single-strand DNA-binding protein